MSHPAGLAVEVKSGLTPAIRERVYDLRYSVYLEFIDNVSDRVFARLYSELDRHGELALFHVRFYYKTSDAALDFFRSCDSIDDATDLINSQYNIITSTRFDAVSSENLAKRLNDDAYFQIQECFRISERPEVGSPVLLQEITVEGDYTVIIESYRESFTVGDVPKIRHYFNYEWQDGYIREYTLHIIKPVMRYEFDGPVIRWVIESGFGDIDNRPTFYYIDLTEAVVDVNYKLKVALDCYTEQMPFYHSTREMLKEFINGGELNHAH